ncbi:MAG: hypothetical protein LBE49_08265 [Deltaproteobacteria bacterium]|nr:hypothetical protein [Deltaproteobacteria bacterium]
MTKPETPEPAGEKTAPEEPRDYLCEIPERLDKVAFLAIKDAALKTMSLIGRERHDDKGPPYGTLEAVSWAFAIAAEKFPKEGRPEGDPAAIREAARAAFFEAYEYCSHKVAEEFANFVAHNAD